MQQILEVLLPLYSLFSFLYLFFSRSYWENKAKKTRQLISISYQRNPIRVKTSEGWNRMKNRTKKLAICGEEKTKSLFFRPGHFPFFSLFWGRLNGKKGREIREKWHRSGCLQTKTESFFCWRKREKDSDSGEKWAVWNAWNFLAHNKGIHKRFTKGIYKWKVRNRKFDLHFLEFSVSQVLEW